MVKLNKIYTRTGDDGTTSLNLGARIAKYDLRMDVIGTVDEANAVVGLVRLSTHEQKKAVYDQMLQRIQQDLFDLGADLSTREEDAPEGGALRMIASQVERLEREIDGMNGSLSPLDSFVLPGGSPESAHLHQARTVVRRAERLMCELADKETINPFAIAYINRLSDHLFVLARAMNNHGQGDVLWQPGINR